ncbi:hypothetical protein AWB81_06834 [Caballeronia arationis]|jgi:hypothetical protein|uniref:Uncharacterized protein n=1 Tax=Caballeronia arationis TaxID=1777142 RepID=A0A7Z7I7D2_9BURK|nr:hypothetical protein [Caballeronia arationis]SAL04740.1 hypothetical protein AWB81_06834 [Caballeronia arationis]SOE67037.1 hypothetical protein SAMN05446927_3207 [Caballeronia arationis]
MNTNAYPYKRSWTGGSRPSQSRPARVTCVGRLKQAGVAFNYTLGIDVPLNENIEP